MGYSFRRRVKIAPGVHLNLGKKGMSFSLGGNGISLTTGKNGAYLTTGIPGTGIYNRKKLKSTQNNESNAGCFYPLSLGFGVLGYLLYLSGSEWCRVIIFLSILCFLFPLLIKYIKYSEDCAFLRINRRDFFLEKYKTKEK